MKTIITGKVQLQYVHIFSPDATDPYGNNKYSVRLIISKLDINTKRMIDNAIEDAVERKWGARVVSRLKLPVKDGDTTGHYEGCYYLDCKSPSAPNVVDRHNRVLLSTDSIQDGDYGRVKMTASAYEYSNIRGVTFYLNGVQFIERGTPLKSESLDFGVWVDPASSYNEAPSLDELLND